MTFPSRDRILLNPVALELLPGRYFWPPLPKFPSAALVAFVSFKGERGVILRVLLCFIDDDAPFAAVINEVVEHIFPPLLELCNIFLALLGYFELNIAIDLVLIRFGVLTLLVVREGVPFDGCVSLIFM